jgi:hypothetical protein
MTVHFGFLRCFEYARAIQFRPKMKEGEREMVKEGEKYERLVVERKEMHDFDLKNRSKSERK